MTAYGDMVVQTGLDVDYSTFKDNFNEGTEITGKTLDQTQIAVFGESEYFINENWIATLGAASIGATSSTSTLRLAPTWCGSLLSLQH